MPNAKINEEEGHQFINSDSLAFYFGSQIHKHIPFHFCSFSFLELNNACIADDWDIH